MWTIKSHAFLYDKLCPKVNLGCIYRATYKYSRKK